MHIQRKLDAHLLAIDAYSGRLIWNATVADSADINCKSSREFPIEETCYSITHAPLVVGDKVLVGRPAGKDRSVVSSLLLTLRRARKFGASISFQHQASRVMKHGQATLGKLVVSVCGTRERMTRISI
jgi:hypothetical protein